MRRFQPTALDASFAKLALANAGIKARVRRLPYALRVCLIGEPTEALRAATAEVLTEWDLRSPTGGALTWNQAHEAFAYVVR